MKRNVVTVVDAFTNNGKEIDTRELCTLISNFLTEKDLPLGTTVDIKGRVITKKQADAEKRKEGRLYGN